MSDLAVALVQDEIIANNPEANLAQFARLCLQHKGVADVIVLPEVFTTGFCSSARSFAELPDGRAYCWMADQAAITGAVVTGSLVVKEGDSYFNRLIWMRPDGSYEIYDKRHLFRMAGEHHRYQQGRTRLILEHKGWRILPQICYDLRFPVWSRNQDDYDLAIYTANWPAARSLHWRRLLQARAIENLSYVVGVNRIGTDEAGQFYSGHSSIYQPNGECQYESEAREAKLEVLDKAALVQYRERFPAHLDRDSFQLMN